MLNENTFEESSGENSIDIDDDVNADNDDDIQLIPPITLEGRRVKSAAQPRKVKKDAVKNSQSSRRCSKEKDKKIEALIMHVGAIVTALAEEINVKLNEKLKAAVYEMDNEFPLTLLDAVYDKLRFDSFEASSFSARPLASRRAWVQRFEMKLGSSHRDKDAMEQH